MFEREDRFANNSRYIATDMNIDTRSNEDTTYYDSITKRIPMGKWGDPLDFKGPAIFLASRASSYVSGEILLVRYYNCQNNTRQSLTKIRSMVGGWLAEWGPFSIMNKEESELSTKDFP